MVFKFLGIGQGEIVNDGEEREDSAVDVLDGAVDGNNGEDGKVENGTVDGNDGEDGKVENGTVDGNDGEDGKVDGDDKDDEKNEKMEKECKC